MEVNAEIETALSRAKAGDKKFFACLVREHQSLVFSIARQFLGVSSLAEEIAQDIFLELFRNLNKIESGSHLLYWLRRTTTNRCIDQTRKLAFRTEVPIADGFLAATQAGMVETMKSGDILREELLRRQVSALPEWQRAVVILRFQEDLDPIEIAGILKIPVNTVKSRLHRALSSLRESLDRKQRVARA